jgi:fibronectin-binding autotransporter adhesin
MTGGLLTKNGAGAFTLAGAFTPIGLTTLNDGALIVNGSISGTVAIAAGVLGGSGSVGLVSATAGNGIVAPGPSAGSGVGILQTSGIRLGIGMTLAIELNGTTAGTGYDRVA